MTGQFKELKIEYEIQNPVMSRGGEHYKKALSKRFQTHLERAKTVQN